MHASEKKQFAEAMVTLGMVFGVELQTPALRAYWEDLADLPWTQVEHGMRACRRLCRFMPRPVDIRDHAGAGQQQSIDEQAINAWSLVDKAARRPGGTGDQDIEQVVKQLGGWNHVRTMDEQKFLTFWRKEFMEAFSAHLKRRGNEVPQLNKSEAADALRLVSNKLPELKSVGTAKE